MQELFTWYEQTPLPIFEPKRAKVRVSPMPRSPAESTLCHVSITKWLQKAEVKVQSRKRLERCARITGSVAMQTVRILNAQHGRSFKSVSKTLPETQACRTCHAATKLLDHVPLLSKSQCNAEGKMACATCHKAIKKVGDKHPLDVKKD